VRIAYRLCCPTYHTRRTCSDSPEHYFFRYSTIQQEFHDFVLGHYIAEGVAELDQEKLPHLLELKDHTVADAVESLKIEE